MLIITREGKTLTVTKGAYNSIYAPQGWEVLNSETHREVISGIVSDNNDITQTISENDDLPLSENDSEIKNEDLDFSEIPLSEMSVSQLKTYGKQLGIEINTDSAKTLRNRIKKALEV